MKTKITRSKLSIVDGPSMVVQIPTTTILKRFSVPAAIIGAALALVMHGQASVQAQPAPPAPTVEQLSVPSAESSTIAPSPESKTAAPSAESSTAAPPAESSTGVDAGSDAEAFTVAPSCVNLIQGRDGNTAWAEATNRCKAPVRLRMIWAWAGDGACTSLPVNWYLRETRGAALIPPRPYVDELRSC